MREKLSDMLSKIQAELEKLSCDPAHPDIVGEHVKHKTWGSGTIVSCDNGVMEIKFNIGIKKLQYPDSINKYIFLEKPQLNLFYEELNKNEQQRNILEKELLATRHTLSNYTTTN